MRLSQWLAQNGRTQQWLAEAVGVTQGRISQIVAGGWSSREVFAKIAEVTGGQVTADDFVEPPNQDGAA